MGLTPFREVSLTACRCAAPQSELHIVRQKARETAPGAGTPRAAHIGVIRFGGHYHPLILSYSWEVIKHGDRKKTALRELARPALRPAKTPDGKRRYLSFTANTKKEAEYQALQYQLHYKEVNRTPPA